MRLWAAKAVRAVKILVTYLLLISLCLTPHFLDRDSSQKHCTMLSTTSIRICVPCTLMEVISNTCKWTGISNYFVLINGWVISHNCNFAMICVTCILRFFRNFVDECCAENPISQQLTFPPCSALDISLISGCYLLLYIHQICESFVDKHRMFRHVGMWSFVARTPHHIYDHVAPSQRDQQQHEHWAHHNLSNQLSIVSTSSPLLPTRS